jgi:hypothetical protein
MIDQAFADVPMPSAKDFCASFGPEAAEDTEPFVGKKWQDLDPDFIDRYQGALFWFTPEAFHYYLPAFLKAGLARPKAVHVVTILQLLQPTSAETRFEFRKQRWKRLSEPQILALADWLRQLQPHAQPGGVFDEEIKQGLQIVQDRYWW